jgi:adenylate cyclase
MDSSSASARIRVTGEGSEREIKLGDCLTIGRSSRNGLVIDQLDASRKHAEIRHLGGGRYCVFDLGSRNGTFVNGQRVSGSRALHHHDKVSIGDAVMEFVSPLGDDSRNEMSTGSINSEGLPTLLGLNDGTVIVLVSDIRNYTSLTEKLPRMEFQSFVSEWFGAVIQLVERNSGVVDKMIGDAIMAYWVLKDRERRGPEVCSVLTAARSAMALSHDFAGHFRERFGVDAGTFEIGIGINMGDASIGNIGTGANQAFTVVGDCVVVAFRLEGLAKEKGHPIIVSREVAQWATGEFELRDLGRATVKGREEPIDILALTAG